MANLQRYLSFALILISLMGLMTWSACGKASSLKSTDNPSPPIAAKAESLKIVERSRSIAIRDRGYCRIDSAGALACIQLSIMQTFVHQPIGSGDGPYRDVVAFRQGFCALDLKGKVSCWRGFDSLLSAAPTFSGRYAELASSKHLICARTDAGDVDCVGTQRTGDKPLIARRLTGGVQALFGGERVMCGLDKKSAFCAKESIIQYQQKTGTNPRWRTSLQGRFVEVRSDYRNMCARTADGIVICKSLSGPSQPETHPGRHLALSDGAALCLQSHNKQWHCPFGEVENNEATLATAFGSHHKHSTYQLVGIDEKGDLVGPSIGRVKGPFVKLIAYQRQVCGVRSDETVYCHTTGTGPTLDTRNLASVKEVRAQVYREELLASMVGLATEDSEMWPQIYSKTIGNGIAFERLGEHGKNFKTAAKTLSSAPDGLRDVQATHEFGCGFRTNGSLRCWGTIRGGKKRVQAPKGRFEHLAVGGHSAAAIEKGTNALVTWGANPWGGFPPKEGRFKALRATYLNHCAETLDGRVHCWGGAFPRGFELPFVPHDYALLSVGLCAIRKAGAPLECFGTGIEWNP